jgi:Spy/CpxP family protein refolding chaperone
LQSQLAALIAERDEKVAAVLTPEQLKEVEKFRAEAESKRKRGKAGKEKVEAETSSE